MFKFRCIIGAIALLAFAAYSHATPTTELQFDKFWRSIQALDSENISRHERAARASSIYQEQISDQQNIKSWEKKTVSELELLFRAAYILVTNTQNHEHIKDMNGLLSEMEKRGSVRKIFYTNLFKALVLTRSFEEARQLQADQPKVNFGKLPSFRDSPALNQQSPTVWNVDLQKNEYLRQNMQLRGNHIIVVSHPSCNFSWKALSAIHADPVLSPLFFNKTTTWLLPQSENIELETIRLLNSNFPEINAKIVVYEAEWSQLDTWATPTFYFLKDGVMVAKVVGWPEGGNREKIVAALKKVTDWLP